MRVKANASGSSRTGICIIMVMISFMLVLAGCQKGETNHSEHEHHDSVHE